ncbi:MAG TPA: hypothetical protein VHL31_07470 [Geminicoccus sp.]|uniref:hypothetical protein n=1 Tax=Geminicoccus sp. TaxID=2024832 RepID=UPI002E36F1C5|nr:hypothetical protein [Geminicoccus sp.]HEX2526126.1 hypothetical protein [Geminicoccus sp.]
MGLSAWKVMLIAGVVLLLFLPRFIRMGGMLKSLSERFIDREEAEPQAHAYRRDGSPVIDGSTGLVVEPEAQPAKLSFAERIGMALARLVRMFTQRLSA